MTPARSPSQYVCGAQRGRAGDMKSTWTPFPKHPHTLEWVNQRPKGILFWFHQPQEASLVLLAQFPMTGTHTRVHSYTHTCTQACTHTCTTTHIHPHRHVHTCAQLHTYVHTGTHTCAQLHIHVHTGTHTCVHSYTHTCAQARTCVRIGIHTHVHRHTHTRAQAPIHVCRPQPAIGISSPGLGSVFCPLVWNLLGVPLTPSLPVS